MNGPILVCLGTRPEAIKLAPVVAALTRRGMPVRVVTTGQHREMLAQALAAFDLRPDVDLGLMREDQVLAQLLSRAVAALDREIAATGPSAVLVQGDTTTALAGALAAAYRQVPVGHVEAGLRTGDLASPFPEEANRRLIGPVSRWHFCATDVARGNLLREGVAADDIHVTGNTVIDAALQTRERLGPGGPRDGRRTILVTMHRRESQGERQRQISRMLRRLADRPDVHIVFPVHLSPTVRASVLPELDAHPRVRLCDPFDYAEFIRELSGAHLVLTDSGGVQEEAPAFDVPVLVMREVTERPEGVAAGCARLCGTDPEAIFAEAEVLLDDDAAHARMAGAPNPYGDGAAAERIGDVLLLGGIAPPALAASAACGVAP